MERKRLNSPDTTSSLEITDAELIGKIKEVAKRRGISDESTAQALLAAGMMSTAAVLSGREVAGIMPDGSKVVIMTPKDDKTKDSKGTD